MRNKVVSILLMVSLILSSSLSLSAQMRLYDYVSAPLEWYKNDSLANFLSDYSEPDEVWKIKGLYDEISYYLDTSKPLLNSTLPYYRFDVFKGNKHYQLHSLKMPITNLRRDTLVYYNNENVIFQIRKKHWVIPIKQPNYVGRNGKWLIFQSQDWTSVLFNTKSKRKKYVKKCFVSSDLDAIIVKNDSLFLEEKNRKSFIGLAIEKAQIHNGYKHSFFQNGRINRQINQPFSCFVLGDNRLYVRLENGYRPIYSSTEKISVQQFPTKFYPAYGVERFSNNVPILLSEGCIVLKKQGKLGVIDTNGIVRVPFIIDSIEGDFQNNLLAVQILGKWGYVNSMGQTIINPQFEEARPFYDKLTAIRLNDKWGYINMEGILVIPCQYFKANPFMFGTATVSKAKNGDRYRIDPSNTIIKENGEKY